MGVKAGVEGAAGTPAAQWDGGALIAVEARGTDGVAVKCIDMG